MMRYFREVRFIPIALVASAALLVLTIADLALDGGHWLMSEPTPPHDADAVAHGSPDAPPSGALSWAQQMFSFPGGAAAPPSQNIAPAPIDAATAARVAEGSNPDITGSIAAIAAPAAAGGAPAPAGQNPKDPKDPKGPSPDGTLIPINGAAAPAGAERAILERLQQRREELDSRARELDIRESLVKAAENRIGAQLTELKEVEARIADETKQKDEYVDTRCKGLVTMSENMKPRDAAKIFNGLDMDVLIKVASQINPRSMAEIMAQMSPDMAERLTVEMASVAQQTGKNDPGALPKIVGHPTGQ